MDIATPKGKATLAHERRAIELLRSKHPEIAYIHTRKDKACRVDGVLIKNNSIHAVVETKCRRMNIEQFRHDFQNEWLVTFDKVVEGRRIAQDLFVPFIGMLYLVDSDILLVQRIADETGEWCVPMRIKRTETQKTVNGGSIYRTNAYIKLASPSMIVGNE